MLEDLVVWCCPSASHQAERKRSILQDLCLPALLNTFGNVPLAPAFTFVYLDDNQLQEL